MPSKCSLAVDLTFEQSENFAIVVASLSSCSWPALKGVVYEVIGSKFVLLLAHCTNSWHTTREMILFSFSLSMCMSLLCVHIRHTLPHD